MQMIFNRAIAEELSEKYIVLELEPHVVQDAVLETFCVVESDKIPITEVTMLDHWKKLHREFVQANKDKNTKLCQDLAEHLMGKFGGEVDSFYEVVLDRAKFKQEQITS
jgi:hypothetical protein